jgi:hypothetical protein
MGLFSRRARTQFAIVCMGRTGSTLLQNLLNSHPEIECKGELFSPANNHPVFADFPKLSRRKFLERHAYDAEKPIRGFKMPFEWILHHPGIFEDLAAMGYKIVRLSRGHPLEHFVSSKLADINNDWSSREPYQKQHLTVSPVEFMAFCGIRSDRENTLDVLCRPLPKQHFIVYEHFFNLPMQHSLLSFLDAPHLPLSSPTVKGRTIPLHQAITNYDELVAFFADTPYKVMFAPVPKMAPA